jgi:DNA polymerase-4
MGIVWIRTMQEMPMELMERVLGQNGTVIWKKANAIDNSPVEPYSERKSISTERTFDQDTIDVKGLKALLVSMTEKLAYQLRQEEQLTACVTVKIRYSDFNTYTMQARIPYTSLDHTLMQKVAELFDKLYQRRMLIRLIGVRFSHLIQGSYQYNMFEDSAPQLLLYQAMDKMRQRYKDDSIIKRASGMGISHNDFNPFKGGQKDLVKKT